MVSTPLFCDLRLLTDMYADVQSESCYAEVPGKSLLVLIQTQTVDTDSKVAQIAISEDSGNRQNGGTPRMAK